MTNPETNLSTIETDFKPHSLVERVMAPTIQKPTSIEDEPLEAEERPRGEVEFFTATSADMLPEQIPASIREDMIGVPLAFKPHQKDTTSIDEYFDTKHIFPIDQNLDYIFLNSILIATSLKAFGKEDSAQFWLDLTDAIQSETLDLLPEEKRQRSRNEAMNQTEEMYPMFGSGGEISGHRMTGGVPIVNSMDQIETRLEQVYKFDELEQSVSGLKYVLSMACCGRGRYLPTYGIDRVEERGLEANYWAGLAEAALKDPVLKSYLYPAWGLYGGFPENPRLVMEEHGLQPGLHDDSYET